MAYFAGLLLLAGAIVRGALGDEAAETLAARGSEIFRGGWSSGEASQFNFLRSNGGRVAVFFDYASDSDDDSNVAFQVMQGSFFEEPTAIIVTNYSAHRYLPGKEVPIEMEVTLIENIFDLKDLRSCNGTISLTLRTGEEKDGLPVGVSGFVESKDCKISFAFEADVMASGLLGPLLFFVLAAGMIVAGISPFLIALRSNDIGAIHSIDDTTLMINAMIDFTHVMISMSFSLRISVEYFQIFSFLTLFLMLSVLLKIRFCLQIFEVKLNRLNLTEGQVRRAKSMYIFKFVLCNIFVVFMSNTLIVRYKLNFFLYLYPAIQVLYNCFFVMRKNCFRLSLHPFLFFPQAVLPSIIRMFPGKVIPLKPDYFYGICLLLEPIAFLWVMRLQKKRGPAFFLSKRFAPMKFDYFSTLSPETELESCPICFSELKELNVPSNLEQQEVANICMQTPCGHRFHVHCLETWMEQKLACPCCRTGIPPY